MLKDLAPRSVRSSLHKLKRQVLSRPAVVRWKGRLEIFFHFPVLFRRPSQHTYKRLHIVLGSVCNNRCIMCYQEEFQRRIDPIIYQKFLLPIYPRIKEIILQGGEPTILPESLQLMNVALQANPDLRFSLFTNGLSLDESWRSVLLSRGGFINFSLNASSPEVHAIVCRNRLWPKVMENLALLIRERNESGSRLEIRLSMVVIPENIKELVSFLELGQSIGSDALHFFLDPRRLPERTIAEPFLSRAADWKAMNPGSGVEGLAALSAAVRGLPLAPIPCSWPLDSLFIDVDGSSSFCCLFRGTLGNIHALSADRLLDTPRAKKWREEFRKGNRNRCGFPCRGWISP